MASPKMVLYGFEQENIQPLHGWTTTKMAPHQLGRDQACEFGLWSFGRWVQEVGACPGVAPLRGAAIFSFPARLTRWPPVCVQSQDPAPPLTCVVSKYIKKCNKH